MMGKTALVLVYTLTQHLEDRYHALLIALCMTLKLVRINS